MAKVLVTGGLGYIGSHVVVDLSTDGNDVVIIDNLANSSSEVVPRLHQLCAGSVDFVQGDVRDTELVISILKQHNISAVLHFAGLKAVAESVADPVIYYDNNVAGLISVLSAMSRANVRNIVFSSSATVYGEPDSSPISEDAALRPASPYGQSKAMCERILLDTCQSDSAWRAAILRYFNPVGAHASGLLGESPRGVPNNLMPYVVQVAAGQRAALSIFGDDYPTPDGTGVRDYIHVCDLAAGHVSAMRYLTDHAGAVVLNLGTGVPVSVKEMVETFERVNGVAVPRQIAPRRAGDVPAYWSNPSRAQSLLNWNAQHDVAAMCRDAWAPHVVMQQTLQEKLQTGRQSAERSNTPFMEARYAVDALQNETQRVESDVSGT